MKRIHWNVRIGKQKLASWLIASMLFSAECPAIPTAYAGETENGTAAAAETETPETAAAAENAVPKEAEAGQELYAEEYDPTLLHIDETLYVNLDACGNPVSANVVKGLSSTKSIRYQDYGKYTDVINMSNEQTLTLSEDGVSFDLDGDGKKFFFQGSMDADKLELPWTIRVDYKLNGVPVEAEKLAGASGVVEIDVKAQPNENAAEYMKNNMLLTVVIPADDTVYSIDAPGSQTQSVGNISGVAFTALPGEEKEFTARLGTDAYESAGIIVMMVPATLDSFDNITDIKDLKDTWKDSGDAMYDSLQSLLSATSSLRSEMDGLRAALDSTESARQKLSAAKPGIFSATDEALASVLDLSTSVQKMIPYLSTAQTSLTEINRDLNTMVDTLGGMTASLHTLYSGLNRLEDGSYGVEYDVSGLESLVTGIEKSAKELGDQIGTFEELADLLLSQYGSMKELLKLAGLSASEQKQLLSLMEAAGIATDSVPSVSELEDLTAMLAAELGSSNDIVVKLEALLNKLSATEATMSSIASGTRSVLSDLEEFLSGAGKTAQGFKYTANDLRSLIEDTEQLNETVNVFYPDLQNALTESEALLAQTGTTLNEGTNALSVAHEAIKNSSDDADKALSQSIETSLSMIEKSLTIFDSLDSLRSAGTTAKDALDSEVDKFEDENRFLEMDPEATRQSFTSEKNREPDSVQIVLRTDEISEDDAGEEVLDAEVKAENPGLWQRIKNVFLQIFAAIAEIFDNL